MLRLMREALAPRDKLLVSEAPTLPGLQSTARAQLRPLPDGDVTQALLRGRACTELLSCALHLLHSGGGGSDGISRLLMSGFSQLLPAKPKLTSAHICPAQRTKSKPLAAGGFTRAAVTPSPIHARHRNTEAGWVGMKKCLYFCICDCMSLALPSSHPSGSSWKSEHPATHAQTQPICPALPAPGLPSPLNNPSWEERRLRGRWGSPKQMKYGETCSQLVNGKIFF